MISAEKIARRRQQTERTFLVQQAEIWRQEQGRKGAYGGLDLRYRRVRVCACRLQAASRGQVTEFGKQSIAPADWEVLLPVGETVAFPDEIRIDGFIYEVRGTDAGSPESNVLIVYCNRKK